MQVYGMQQITFRVIIDQYKVCPHHQGNSKIFREVLLADGQKRDIIAFYNTTYIPIMEKSLLDFPQVLHLIMTHSTSHRHSVDITSLIRHHITLDIT